jgi:nitroreductase
MMPISFSKEVVMEVIFSRRSIRAYTQEPIPEPMVEKLLRAGMSAPSAGNQQPWHFVVLKDRQVLDQVPHFHPHAEMILQAPMAIVVCGDLSLETHKGMWMLDCSNATENILLAAHALGLGAVWCALYPREERMEGMRRLLNLPKQIIPLSLVPIGYPAEEKPAVDRYQETRVHYDKW